MTANREEHSWEGTWCMELVMLLRDKGEKEGEEKGEGREQVREKGRKSRGVKD